MSFILGNGIHCWRTVPKLAGLLRCGKSCRLRWINYLRPDLKRGGFTEAEEDQIIQLHKILGNRWSKIASNFEGRADNEIKNHWNTKIKKRLLDIGVDPKSHELIEPKQTTKAAATTAEVVKLENNDREGSDDELEKIDKIVNSEVDLDDDLLSDYEIFNRRLEVLEHWPNGESIKLDGQSLSISASMSEIKTRNNNNLDQWYDETESFFGFSDPNDEFPYDDLSIPEDYFDRVSEEPLTQQGSAKMRDQSRQLRRLDEGSGEDLAPAPKRARQGPGGSREVPIQLDATGPSLVRGTRPNDLGDQIQCT